MLKLPIQCTLICLPSDIRVFNSSNSDCSEGMNMHLLDTSGVNVC